MPGIVETATLQTVYWVTLAAGLILLILSVVLGDVFDFLDVDLGGTDLAVMPMLFTATSAFGAGGLIGIEAFGLGRGGSIFAGLGAGIAAGGLAGALFSMLRRQQADAPFELGQLVGRRGRVSLAVGPGRVGKVSVTFEGMTRTYSADATEEIGDGEEIVVSDVIGSRLSVARPGPVAPEGG